MAWPFTFYMHCNSQCQALQGKHRTLSSTCIQAGQGLLADWVRQGGCLPYKHQSSLRR